MPDFPVEGDAPYGEKLKDYIDATAGNGTPGQDGDPGPPGEGVPTGGDTGQKLVKASDADFDTEWTDDSPGGVTSVNTQTGDVVLTAADVGADASGAAAAAQAASQPVDSDLTAIAALTTTSYGRALLALADAAAGRTAFGLGTAATTASTAYDAAGAAAAAQAASQPVDSDLTAIAALTTTSYGRSLLILANQAALVTALGNIPESQVTNLVTDLAAKAPIASPTFTGTVTLPADGASGLQPVTWQQWQAALTAQDAKDPVAYASTAALPANTYANGTSGVGATLTGNSNGPLIIDGVTILIGQVGERVLVGGESAASHNGVYTITQQGVVAVSPYVLTRAVDFDQPSEVDAGDLVPVTAPSGFTAGSVNNGKVFLTVVPSPVVFGTSSISFSSVGGTYSAGTGLTLSGSTFAIDTAVTVDTTTAQTLTNKTLTAPVLNSPTGLAAADIPNLAATKITSGLLALARGGTNAATVGDVVSATKGAANLIPRITTDAGGRITVIDEVPFTLMRIGGLRAIAHSYGSVSGNQATNIGTFANYLKRLAVASGAPPAEVELWYHSGLNASVPTLGDTGSGGIGIGGAFRFAFPLHMYSSPTITAPYANGRAYPVAQVINVGGNDPLITLSANKDPNAINTALDSMRAILSYWRARAAYYVSVGVASGTQTDGATVYNGTWSGTQTDKNYVAGGKYQSTTTLNDYAEFTIPTTYQGGTISLLLLGGAGGYTTITSALTDTTGTSVAAATRTCFPTSGQFVIQIDSEQMLVTAGNGTGAGTLTVTRGYNGTTAATHLNAAPAFRPRTNTYLDFTGSTANLDGTGAGVAPVSVRGFDGSGRYFIGGRGSSGANIAGSQRIGYDIQMAARFTGLTAADAGLKIRAQLKNAGTQTVSVPGAFFRPFCWVIEDSDPPPQLVPNQMTFPLIGSIWVDNAAAVATFNANVVTLVGEFPGSYLVDFYGTYAAFFEGTIQTATSTGTTVHMTPTDSTRNILSKGSVIQVEGECMLVTSTITKTSSTDWSFTVTRAYSGTDAIVGTGANANHAIGALVSNAAGFTTNDGTHPSDLGHELLAAQCMTTLAAIPATYTKIAQSGGYKARDQQGWAQPVSSVPYAFYRPNSNGNRGTQTLTLTKEWAEPLWIPETGILTTFECYVVTGGASSTVRFCLYVDGKGAPEDLVYDTGASYGPGVVASATSSAWATASIVGGLPVVRGWYWMSVTAQTGTAPVVRANNAGSPPMRGYCIPEDQATAASTHAATGLSRTFSAGTTWAIASQTLEVDSQNWPLVRAGFEKYILG